MKLQKKYLLVIVSIIIIFQLLIYTNNSQSTSFRYFKWTAKELSIGKLICISFFSGLSITTLLNTTFFSYKKITFKNIEDDYEAPNNEEGIKSNVEMPPQRDIRDAQPTISVNYRVVKNNEVSMKRDDSFVNTSINNDDWDNEDNEW